MLTLNFHPFPVLETERLILRQVKVEDAAQIFAMRSDENAMKYLDRLRPKSIDEIYTLIEKITTSFNNNEGISWALTLKNSDSLIGNISYHKTYPEHHRAEIGYMLYPAYWGKGLMNEAVKKIIEFGFSELKFHSLEANVNPNNTNSIKILERNGFVREAYFKENYFYNGKFLDSAIYSLITPLSYQAK